MRLALLFSGQGGQGPAHWQQVQAGAHGELGEALLRVLPGIADPSLTIMETTAGPRVNPEKLAKNKIAQPLIFAQQMLLWGELQNRLPRPICAAGYSLGEMAACCAAGAFTVVEGIALCAERAAVMDAAAAGEHGMLAVLGLDDALVETLAEQAGLAVATTDRHCRRCCTIRGSGSEPAGPSGGADSFAHAVAESGGTRLQETA